MEVNTAKRADYFLITSANYIGMLTMTVLINHPKSLDGLLKIVGKRLLHQIRPVSVLLVSGPGNVLMVLRAGIKDRSVSSVS